MKATHHSQLFFFFFQLSPTRTENSDTQERRKGGGGGRADQRRKGEQNARGQKGTARALRLYVRNLTRGDPPPSALDSFKIFLKYGGTSLLSPQKS